VAEAAAETLCTLGCCQVDLCHHGLWRHLRPRPWQRVSPWRLRGRRRHGLCHLRRLQKRDRNRQHHLQNSGPLQQRVRSWRVFCCSGRRQVCQQSRPLTPWGQPLAINQATTVPEALLAR
jgi:hypothetical protein